VNCHKYPCSGLDDLRVEAHDGVDVHVGWRPSAEPYVGHAFAVRHEGARTAAATDYVALSMTDRLENVRAGTLDEILRARIDAAQRCAVRLVLSDPRWWDDLPIVKEAP
jgi:hypothetical protein